MNKTGIEYLDYTWNPVTGCSPVGPGCDNCWARRMANRLRGRCGYPADDPFRVTFHPERLDEPLRLKKPARIGVCFMGDLFHDGVDPGWVEEILRTIAVCHRHRFFILTKRPHNIGPFVALCDFLIPGNLWLGVSVWDQNSADRLLVPYLLHGPLARKWVSYEPALGPVDFSPWIPDKDPIKTTGGGKFDPRSFDSVRSFVAGGPVEATGIVGTKVCLDWIVMGGETGPGARPMHPDWARSVRDQCAAAGVPFCLKSLGKWRPRSDKSDCERVGMNQFGVLSHDGSWSLNTTGWNARDIDPDTGEAYLISTPGRTAGSFLDGRLHDDVPE